MKTMKLMATTALGVVTGMRVNEIPHGRLKQSGYGKDMSSHALEDCTVVRHVMVKHR